MTQVSLLTQAHATYRRDDILELSALYNGGRLWRSMIDHWIPKNHAEDPMNWEDRKARATYRNMAAPRIDMLAAWLFQAKPLLGADVPPAVAQLEKDANGEGLPLGEVLAQLFTSALVHKKAYAWINLPSQEDSVPESLVEQKERGLLNPYIVELSVENVLDWGEDDRGKLSWVKIYYHDVYKETPLSPPMNRHRWLIIDAERIQRWELFKPLNVSLSNADQAEQKADVYHNYGRLPVVRLELASGLWAMEKMRDPAIDLLRLHNDLQWGLHRGANPLLVGETPPNGVVSEGAPPVVGAGRYMETFAKIYYVEPDGRSFNAMQKAINAATEDLHRVIHQMAMAAGGSSGGAASGASKRRDWEALQIVMSAYARVVSDFLTNIVQLVAEVVDDRKDYRPEIGGMNAWRRRTLEQFMEAATMSVSAQMRSETLQKEIAKQQATLMLSEDVDPSVMTAIHKEIEESPPMGQAMALLGKGMGDDVFKATGLADELKEDDEQGTEARKEAQDKGLERGRNEK